MGKPYLVIVTMLWVALSQAHLVACYVATPLNCSSSNVSRCQAYLYVANESSSISEIERRYNVSYRSNVTTYNATLHDYIVSVVCGCYPSFNRYGFFALATYVWQQSDANHGPNTVSNQYFDGLCWTKGGDYGNISVGEAVPMTIGCGCPVPGFRSILSYKIQPGDMLSYLVPQFNSDQNAIQKLNNIEDPDVIIADTVLFIPTNDDPPVDGKSPPAVLPSTPSPVPSSAPDRAPSPTPRRDPKMALMKYFLPGAFAAVALSLLVTTIAYRRVKRRQRLSSNVDVLPISSQSPKSELSKRQNDSSLPGNDPHENKDTLFDLEISENMVGVKVFSLAELQQATGHFCETNKLGAGAFGKVYKGILEDNTDVAVKKTKLANTFSKKQFLNEVYLLSKLNHPNLVKLIGVCLEEVILVYENVPNGTLADHLAGKFPLVILDWDSRLRISIEIAEAVLYLHNAFHQSTELPGPVYHRDLKPANVLLGDNLVTKVGDFGLSRVILEQSSQVFTNAVGTIGYGDPQYFQYEQLSDKSDVYSFGVILLELITAKKHIDNTRGSDGMHLGMYSQSMMKQGRFEDIVDPRLRGTGSWAAPTVRRGMWRCATLALRCVKYERKKRPSFDEVVSELKKIKEEMHTQCMDGSNSEKMEGRSCLSYEASGLQDQSIHGERTLSRGTNWSMSSREESSEHWSITREESSERLGSLTQMGMDIQVALQD